MSKYRQRKKITAKRLKRRKSVLKDRVFWDVVLGLVFFVVLVYFLFFSAVFRIVDWQVSASPDIETAQVQKIISDYTNYKIYSFLPRNSFWLVNSGQLEKRISADMPLAKKVVVKKRLASKLFVSVEKREPLFAWCFEGGGACFVADENRVVFGQVPAENLTQNLIVIFSKTEPAKMLGEIMGQKQGEQILQIREFFQEQGIGLVNFGFDEPSLLTVKTAQNWEAYFDLQSDTNLALTKLKLLLEKELTADKRKNLQYVDLRFSKAYYK
ncbi:MAG: FtsQ-type POTRA domain-containing protein [Patescibacteria group bacterium]|nr:FtsQ-type POTRA domain-containing protein [Patescibacteria group bacterium]